MHSLLCSPVFTSTARHSQVPFTPRQLPFRSASLRPGLPPPSIFTPRLTSSQSGHRRPSGCPSAPFARAAASPGSESFLRAGPPSSPSPPRPSAAEPSVWRRPAGQAKPGQGRGRPFPPPREEVTWRRGGRGGEVRGALFLSEPPGGWSLAAPPEPAASRRVQTSGSWWGSAAAPPPAPGASARHACQGPAAPGTCSSSGGQRAPQVWGRPSSPAGVVPRLGKKKKKALNNPTPAFPASPKQPPPRRAVSGQARGRRGGRRAADRSCLIYSPPGRVCPAAAENFPAARGPPLCGEHGPRRGFRGNGRAAAALPRRAPPHPLPSLAGRAGRRQRPLPLSVFPLAAAGPAGGTGRVVAVETGGCDRPVAVSSPKALLHSESG